MTHIRTREQLLEWLAVELKRLGRRSLVRALAEGQVELLGGFMLGPPGWIVRVTSRAGQTWNIVVLAQVFVHTHQQAYRIRLLKSVPWHLWSGGRTPLYQGDNPTRYTYLKGFKERLVQRGRVH